MAKAFLSLLRGTMLLIGFLVASGSATSVLAAEDCFEVSEKIKRLPAQDKLVEIRNSLRQHLRVFKTEGQSYEGQYDIACLIGYYMTIGNAPKEKSSAEESLERYRKIEEWFRKRFAESSTEKAEWIALYKESSDLDDQDRAEGYANSEFVLWSLADSADGVATTIAKSTFRTDLIRNEIWCGGPERLERELSQFLTGLRDRVNKVGWQTLSHREFKKANKRFRAASSDLAEICGAAAVISKADVGDIRSHFKSTAKKVVKDAWMASVLHGEPDDTKDWNALKWLNLSCKTGPTGEQYELFSTLRYFIKDPDKNWWAKGTDNQRTKAETLFDGKLDSDLKDSRTNRCIQGVSKHLKQLIDQSQKWKKKYKDLLDTQIRTAWSDPHYPKKSRARLESKRNHLTVITKVNRQCVTPTPEELSSIKAVRQFVEKVNGENPGYRTQKTANMLLKARQALSGIEKAQVRCSFVTVLPDLEDSYVDSEGNYRTWAKKQSLDVWSGAIGQEDIGEEEAFLAKIYPEFLPTSQDKKIISFLFRLDLPDPLPSKESIQALIDKSKQREMEGEIFGRILGQYRQVKSNYDESIIDRWSSLLITNCATIGREVSELLSLSQRCATPDPADITTLVNYCRLKGLKTALNSRKSDDNKEGSGEGEGGEGGEGGDSGSIDGFTPFWDHENAILVAGVVDGFWSKSFDEINLIEPVSEEVSNAGFTSYGELISALHLIAKNSNVEALLKSKLKGCAGEVRFHKEERKLVDLRKFYIEAYVDICDDSDRTNRPACKMSRTLRKGVPQNKSTTKNDSSTRLPQIKQIYQLVWRSDVGNDEIYIDGDNMGNTGPNTKTSHNRGKTVTVYWNVPEGFQYFKFNFTCCELSAIEAAVARAAVSTGNVLVEVEPKSTLIKIKFVTKTKTQPKALLPDKKTCHVYYTDNIGYGKQYIFPSRPSKIFSQDVELTLVSGNYFRLDNKKYVLGERLNNYVIAAIGDDFIVLALADIGSNTDIKDLIGNRAKDSIHLRSSFVHRPKLCTIKP